MVPLIRELFEALESEGVDYCHWKSNAHLAAAVDGDDDLDLLVSSAGRPAFLRILQRLGFKEAWTSDKTARIPGIQDHYGHDGTAARLIHVHAHDKLVLGQDFTKNYHLPIESAYLASATAGEWARVPAPELEWCVYVIRMILKHSTWSTILGGLGALSGRELAELEFLQRSAAPDRVSDVLSRHLPSVDPRLFEECVRALRPDRSAWAGIRAGRRLQKALRGCRLRPAALDVWLQFWRRLDQAARRRLFRRSLRNRKRLMNGGLLVAVVGGDGSGKTTLIKGISEWLCPPFAGLTVHMGKPSWSFSTTLVRAALKVGRTLRLYPFERAPLDPHTEAAARPFPGYPSLVREVCTARDRYLSYKRARRRADQGLLVICDRFPLAGRLLTDGPLVGHVARAFPRRRLAARLARLEERYYRFILPPDLLLVLKADPETAVARKPEERPESVRARTKEIWDKDWAGSNAIAVDASRTKDEVQAEVKAILWARI